VVQASANGKNTGSPSGRRAGVAQWIVWGYLTVLAVLAPLKFGISVGVGEISVMPLNWVEWLFTPWPPFAMPLLTGIGLIAAIAVCPRPPQSTWLWLVPGVWALVLLTSLAGLINTTEHDYAQLFLFHILGVCCYSLSVFWTITRYPQVRRWLGAGVVAGTLCVLLSGWHQAIWGFKETQDYIWKQIYTTGMEVPKELWDRLNQNRVFSTFVYPNSFAAHLMLTGPLTLLLLWRWGGRVEPPRASRALFVGTGAVLWITGLVLAGSRAGFCALSVAVVGCVLLRREFKHWRIPIAIGCLVMASSLLVFLSRDRGDVLASLGMRGTYWRAAGRMFLEHPVAGIGLGEFFPNYMRLKPPDAEETRTPHNMLCNLASQAGILAGLAGCLCLLMPLLAGRLADNSGQGPDPPLLAAVQIGLGAWYLHSLADFNLMIPGTLMLVSVWPLFCVNRAVPSQPVRPAAAGVVCAVLLLAVASVGSAHRFPGAIAYERLYRLVSDPKTSFATVVRQANAAADKLPYSPYPWVVIGRIARQLGLYAKALEAYQRASVRAPHRSAFYLHQGECHCELGQITEAHRVLAQAREWYPHNKKAQPLTERLQQQ